MRQDADIKQPPFSYKPTTHNIDYTEIVVFQTVSNRALSSMA